MRQLNNAMELYKILENTNCGECDVPTCLAFAAAVFRGEKSLKDCPHVESDATDRYDVRAPNRRTLEREQEKALDFLKTKIADMDFASSAERLGASFSGDKLTVKCLGKDFSVDSKGNVISDCHVHGWITIPLLNYVISCTGKAVSGRWVPFRELKNGGTWNPLFGQRCEKPLKRVADTHTDLFDHMVHIFSGKPAPNEFAADISIVLHPLPRVPILICFWNPDDGLESSLNLFFDDTAEDNLNIESLYTLCAGLVLMFEKIVLTHGADVSSGYG